MTYLIPDRFQSFRVDLVYLAVQYKAMTCMANKSLVWLIPSNELDYWQHPIELEVICFYVIEFLDILKTCISINGYNLRNQCEYSEITIKRGVGKRIPSYHHSNSNLKDLFFKNPL